MFSELLWPGIGTRGLGFAAASTPCLGLLEAAFNSSVPQFCLQKIFFSSCLLLCTSNYSKICPTFKTGALKTHPGPCLVFQFGLVLAKLELHFYHSFLL